MAQEQSADIEALKALGGRLADEVKAGVQKGDTLLHVCVRSALAERLPQHLQLIEYLLSKGAIRIQLNAAHASPLALARDHVHPALRQPLSQALGVSADGQAPGAGAVVVASPHDIAYKESLGTKMKWFVWYVARLSALPSALLCSALLCSALLCSLFCSALINRLSHLLICVV
jgi:hypothetical protein